MRAIIRVTKRETTDEEAQAIKKAVAAAVKEFPGVEVSLNTIE